MKTRISMRAAVVVCLLALAGCGALFAQAPAQQRVRFQARLSDTVGDPVITTTNVTLRLYTAPTGGTAVWQESHPVVPNAQGMFTVLLGTSQDFAGVNFGLPLYVGVTIEADPEMTPRYLLSSASHAHHARSAASLDGTPLSALARLSGASFTGNVSAPSFTGNLTGNASGFTGTLSGDVTGTQGATVVASVGGESAASVAAGALLANQAASANTAGTIVRRDGAGSFIAGTITAAGFVGNLTGNATGFTGNLAGDVTGPMNATFVTSVGGQSAANVSAATGLTLTATSSNSAGMIVRRDSQGAISVGQITALGLTSSFSITGNGITSSGGFTSTGGLTSFTAPQATPTAAYEAHRFASSVQNIGANISTGLSSNMTATGTPGTGTVSAATLRTDNPGNVTQGIYSRGHYTGPDTGTDPTTHFASGLIGQGSVADTGARVLAMGFYGTAAHTQGGSNVGVFATGRGATGSNARNLGLFASANADDTAVATFSVTQLPASMSAGMLAFNNLNGANDYGLYVHAAHNRVVGDLTVTGTLNATISGTVDNANNLGGVPAAQYAQTANLGSMAFANTSDYTATANLGSMAFADTADYTATAGLGTMAFADTADYTTTAGLGSMAFANTADYTTTTGLGSMAFADTADYTTTAGLGSMAFADTADYTATAGLGSMAFADTADYTATAGLGSMAFAETADYTTTAGLGTMAFEDTSTYALAGNVLALSGGTLSGDLDLGGNNLSGAGMIFARNSMEVGGSGGASGWIALYPSSGSSTILLDGSDGSLHLQGSLSVGLTGGSLNMNTRNINDAGHIGASSATLGGALGVSGLASLDGGAQVTGPVSAGNGSFTTTVEVGNNANNGLLNVRDAVGTAVITLDGTSGLVRANTGDFGLAGTAGYLRLRDTGGTERVIIDGDTGMGSFSMLVVGGVSNLNGDVNVSGEAATTSLRVGGGSGPQIFTGAANPAGGLVAPVGSLFLRVSGGGGGLYIKWGSGNTNWEKVGTQGS
jgi:hypothetical protein